MNKAQQNALEFSKATALLQQGRFAEAIPVYEAILRREPRNIGAANLLGIALMQAGRLEEAAAAIRNALRAGPNQPDAHYNLAVVLQTLGRPDEAIVHLQNVIALKPDDPQARNNLGVALKSIGRFEEAADAYGKATALKPDYAEAHANLAAVLFSLKRFKESIRHGEQAVALNPKLAEAHLSLGNSLRADERIDEALQAFERAISLQPNRPETYVNVANTLIAGGYYKRAIPHFERALLLQPETFSSYFKLASCLYLTGRHEEAHAVAEKGFARRPLNPSAEDEISAGSFLQEANRHDEAVLYFKRALDLDPDLAGAHIGYGRGLEIAGRYDDALYHIDRALELAPSDDMLKWNKAIICLSLEKFSEAWKLFDIRFSEKVLFATPRAHNAPRWDGKTLAGTLAIWGEQGLGDQIIYASMIPEAVGRAGGMILEVEPRLIPLFARSFPQAKLRALTEDPGGIRVDAHIPIGGLGEFYRRDQKDFPRRAYLTADPDRAAKLRSLLKPEKKFVIGVSWRSKNQKFGIHKSAELRDFSLLFSRPDIQFVDLQYGDTSAERESIHGEFGVEITHLDEIDNTQDIDGLAALIEACDAVLTVSNTTAHIAGALGKPVWIMMPHAQGRLWYWFQNRRDSPWYPGARLIRQQPGQSWADVVAALAPEMSEFARTLKAGR